MRKNLKTIIGVFFITLIAFASCKKKKSPGPQDYIIGKWKSVQIAQDANNNGTMDASEVMSDTTNTTLSIDKGGTGTATISILTFGFTINFNWTLFDNNSWVKIDYGAIPGGGTGGTIYSHIDKLNGTDMVLKDTTGGMASWTIYAKQ